MNKKSNLIVAVCVFYYPDQDAIVNIKKYINSVNKLIIWDNTPIDFRKNLDLSLIEKDDKIIIMSDGVNRGTAFAYNKVAQWGIANDYNYFLVMDQDGTWENFDFYKKEALDCLQANQNVIITPNINKICSTEQQNINTWCIASGMLFSLALYSQIGLFEENLFVDGVDIDYCLRARILNIRIRKMGSGILYQQFGNKIYSPLLKHSSRNDSPTRTYNIIFNQIRIFKKYRKYVSGNEIKTFVKDFIIKRFIYVVLLEKEKIKKCYMIINASFSGIFRSKTY